MIPKALNVARPPARRDSTCDTIRRVAETATVAKIAAPPMSQGVDESERPQPVTRPAPNVVTTASAIGAHNERAGAGFASEVMVDCCCTTCLLDSARNASAQAEQDEDQDGQ